MFYNQFRIFKGNHMYKTKYQTFLTIADKLNNQGIVPLLMGSLGLELVTGKNWNSVDIDIHVNGDSRGWEASDDLRIYEWKKIETIMKQLGYRLIDMHEHEFLKDDIHVEFGVMDTLPSFAGIDLNEIEIKEDQGVKYFLLNKSQYLKVYNASFQDSYRNVQNNNKDLKKISYLESIINS